MKTEKQIKGKRTRVLNELKVLRRQINLVNQRDFVEIEQRLMAQGNILNWILK